MDQVSQELQRNAEPAPDQLPWNLDFNKISGVHLQVYTSEPSRG